MHAAKFLATLGAPVVGVAVAVAVWLAAPASVALIGGVAAGSALTLLLVSSLGDRRYAPVAGLSTFLGVGVATFVAEFPREGAVEWLLLGFGAAGLCCFLVRVRVGNLRRAAATPVDPSRRRRLVGRVAGPLLAVRESVRGVLSTTPRLVVAGVVAGGASLAIHAYGLVNGIAPLASGGLALVFVLVVAPFYLVTDWRALDGLESRDRAGDLSPGLLERVRRGVGRAVATATGTVTTVRDATPSASGTGTTGGSTGTDRVSGGGATASSTPALGDRIPSASWPELPLPSEWNLPDRSGLPGGASLDRLAPVARSVAVHALAAGRWIGATTVAGVHGLGAGLVGFARAVSNPDEGRRGPSAEKICETSPEARPASGDDVVVFEPESDGDPASEPAEATIAAADPVFTADDGDDRGPDLAAAADAGRTVALDETPPHLPDARQSGGDAVSRRVAEALYGDEEDGDDPDPGEDDWTDQLESPEV